jgi:hypothetical protein
VDTWTAGSIVLVMTRSAGSKLTLTKAGSSTGTMPNVSEIAVAATVAVPVTVGAVKRATDCPPDVATPARKASM